MVPQETHTKVVQDVSQRAGSGGDGCLLRADLGNRDLGILEVQEGGEKVHRRRHGNNATRWTQDQLASGHLHSYW